MHSLRIIISMVIRKIIRFRKLTMILIILMVIIVILVIFIISCVILDGRGGYLQETDSKSIVFFFTTSILKKLAFLVC